MLVAYGLAISLFGPAWRRSRDDSRAGPIRLGAIGGRVTAIAPLVSGRVVLVLGLAMVLRSLAAA